MWKTLWQKWTIDRPASLGDWLWDVFVVQFAAYLDRLTWRKILFPISVIILILAYYHRIPLPPELVLVGDLLAYIDIFAALFLFSVLSRAATVLFVIRQVTARVGTLASRLVAVARRLDFRHQRARGTTSRKRFTGQPRHDDDEPKIVGGFAWAWRHGAYEAVDRRGALVIA
jgi:signal transduction histidine kinase